MSPRGSKSPWLNHSKQPDCVFFSHSAHVIGAEMSCESCHGDIGTSEHTRVYEENRADRLQQRHLGTQYFSAGKTKSR